MILRPLRSTLFPYTTLFRSLVLLLETLGGLLDLDRVVDAPELQLGLLQERVRVDLLVADELHVTDEGALDDDERDLDAALEDRKSTRLNSSHSSISYAVFCL